MCWREDALPNTICERVIEFSTEKIATSWQSQSGSGDWSRIIYTRQIINTTPDRFYIPCQSTNITALLLYTNDNNTYHHCVLFNENFWYIRQYQRTFDNSIIVVVILTTAARLVIPIEWGIIIILTPATTIHSKFSTFLHSTLIVVPLHPTKIPASIQLLYQFARPIILMMMDANAKVVAIGYEISRLFAG